VNVVLVVSAGAQQPTKMLRPPSPGGHPIIPFMEGWYDNGDGSVTVSFGYHNRNAEDVTVPMGENNQIEPAQLGGMQPEIYFPGRHAGAFAVTIPASMEGETVWWHIKTGSNEELQVPGERGSPAYELDRNPRPQGSVQPLIWFENGNRGSGPEGVIATDTKTVAVGEPLTLEVGTEDPSVRDPSNPLFDKPLDSRVIWYKHQGPGEVTFTADPSTPFMETQAFSYSPTGVMSLPASRIAIPAGRGPARVITTFSEPGEYMIRARLDNWNSSDSDFLDQCCWSNGYQRVQVTQ
jgi:hypothetical protein